MANRRLSFGNVADGSVSTRLRRRSSSFRRQPSRKRAGREPERPLKRRREQPQTHVIPVPCILDQPGILVTCGTGDIGQLGLGTDLDETPCAKIVRLSFPVVDIAAGGMHTVCLNEKGEVYTFGCNDEGALGRDTTEDEGLQFVPGKVELQEKIVRVSAGDSHTAALSERGHVFIWGNFKDSKGSMGLDLNGRAELKPQRILDDVVVVQIASGCDHLVCLAENGVLYTCGSGEHGQLGRVSRYFLERGGRRGIGHMLEPAPVNMPKPRGEDKIFFEHIWSGLYSSIARVEGSGKLYGFGLNNTYQLGRLEKKQLNVLHPELLSFEGRWQAIAMGSHHTLAINCNGKLHSLGEGEYGQLGLGEECARKSEPTLVPVRETFSLIGCGDRVSFAVDCHGSLYSWGMGTNGQLCRGNYEDVLLPEKVQSLKRRKILKVCGGGQHTVILISG